MHWKSKLDNSTVDWKQVALRRNFSSYKASRVSSFYNAVLHSSKSSFGEFPVPVERTVRRLLFEWPQIESSLHRSQTQLAGQLAENAVHM